MCKTTLLTAIVFVLSSSLSLRAETIETIAQDSEVEEETTEEVAPETTTNDDETPPLRVPFFEEENVFGISSFGDSFLNDALSGVGDPFGGSAGDSTGIDPLAPGNPDPSDLRPLGRGIFDRLP